MQSGDTRVIAELLGCLDVGERTARRCGDHLCDLDIPIEEFRGRSGGYRLAVGQRTVPLMLTDDGALATMLGASSA